jgi:dihydrofolate synthase / folylpolyglutamate synthase
MPDINKILNQLYKLERTGIKYSLRNIKSLMKTLGNPHRNLKCIHIAGTNGKGATASFIASILTEHGLKTGLFTSPHILKFNDRIRINGKSIPDAYIKKFLQKNTKVIERVKPSFFEVNTALAFKYFVDRKVDFAVIETGLGGRLDSTNIVAPLLTVITQIAIDHTEYLGNTLNKIANEKAGIMKPGVDLIVSDNHKKLRKIFDSPNTIFLDDYLDYKIVNSNLEGSLFRIRSKKKSSPYSSHKDRISKTQPSKEELGENEIFSIPLPGEYQVRNALTAILSVYRLFHYFKMDSRFRGNDKRLSKQSFESEEMRQGLGNVKINSGYRGRFEYVKHRGKNYILDVSHNADGIEGVASTSRKLLKGFKKIIAVFAMMQEKDYKPAVDKLLGFADYIIFTKPEYKRALAPKTLFNYAARPSKTSVTSNVREALIKAEEMAAKNDIIMVTGSFFLVSEAIKELELTSRF